MPTNRASNKINQKQQVDATHLLLLPLPHLLDEGLASEVVPGLALLLLQLLLDHHLGGNTGMIEARAPQGLAARHSVPAGQRVLNGAHERVAQVKCARHIRWRHRHDELFTGRVLAKVLGGALGLEEALLLPPLVPGRLHVQGAVGVWQRASCVLLVARLRRRRVHAWH